MARSADISGDVVQTDRFSEHSVIPQHLNGEVSTVLAPKCGPLTLISQLEHSTVRYVDYLDR